MTLKPLDPSLHVPVTTLQRLMIENRRRRQPVKSATDDEIDVFLKAHAERYPEKG